jgi:diguanylate cyclase (GGDEF)-like protein
LRKSPRPELITRTTELIYFQASNAYSSSIAGGFILAVLFWNSAPRLGIVVWGASYSLMIAIRYLLGKRFLAAPRRNEEAQRWLNYFSIAVGISGVLWGIYGAFLAQYADSYQLAAVLLTLGALLSGAVIAFSVSMPVYLAFSVPTMVPLALWLTISPVEGRRFLGLTVLVWVVFMLFAARRFRRFALESLGYQYNLEQLASQLKQLSTLDGLTNLANRQRFDEELDAAVANAKQEAAPLALILCDVDFFKQYNDAYGQMHADVCLRNIANQLDGVARRAGGWAARVGGEEFAVILSGADAENALRVGEELRAAVEGLRMVNSMSEVSDFVTASFGIGAIIPADNIGSDLLQRAEEALREAKRAGRNRVCAGLPAAPSSASDNAAQRDADPRTLKSVRV